MLSINTNLSSLIAQGSMKQSTNKLNQAIERMTTGYKINHAKDNAANYSISTNITTKIGAYNVAEDNAAMGLDMITTATENLNLVGEHLSRLRDLAEQAANGTYSQKSLDAIQAEVNARTSEINRIVGTTKYNGVELFKGEPEKASKFIKKVNRRDTSTMTSLESVDEEAVLAKGTYSISTAKELAKLATMQNNGKITDYSEFVLAADIDLSEYTDWVGIGDYGSNMKFCGVFDGNGYVVSNLNGNTRGLFGCINYATLKNLGVENVNINSTFGETGALLGTISWGTHIENCYSTGNIICNVDCTVGGLLGGHAYYAGSNNSLINSYSSVNVSSNNFYSAVGGLIGYGYEFTVENCFATGNTEKVASDARNNYSYAFGSFSNTTTVNNCYATGTQTMSDKIIGGYNSADITNNNVYYNTDTVGILSDPNSEGKTTAELEELIEKGILPGIPKPAMLYRGTQFQVGSNASESSQINLNLSFELTIQEIDMSTSEKAREALSYIDSLIKKINAKFVEYGAAENRLESALNEIVVQRENLISSRSTIKDSDIAKVSSSYIQHQILQQASATLLATANQSPSIALQLI